MNLESASEYLLDFIAVDLQLGERLLKIAGWGAFIVVNHIDYYASYKWGPSPTKRKFNIQM